MDKQTYFSLNPWWEDRDFETGFPREGYLKEIFSRFDCPQIEVIVGSRRIGKTTLLKQIIGRQLKRGFPKSQILYLPLDHPLAINVSLLKHLENFRKIFSHKRERNLILVFDEVQEVPRWEIELKALYDTEKVKIICSGSTSALLQSQGGKLTGRQISTIVYPLSFAEFLIFRKIKWSFSEAYLLEEQLEEYLRIGGYPENVLNPSEEYLTSLLDDIFLRDLVRLYPLKNYTAIRNLFKLLTASVGSRISFNRLSKTLGISIDTVKNYIDHLESAFLLKKLEKWSSSYTQRIYSSKKIYLLDTGFKTLLTGKGDLGFKAENVVFVHLLRKKVGLGYFAESQKEVDFIVGDYRSPLPLEVKYVVDDLSLEDRRLGGLRLFLKRSPKIKKAKIITKSLEVEKKFQNKTIELVPLWQFLLK